MAGFLSKTFGRGDVDPATLAANESGMKMLRFTKRTSNIVIHPNDLYVRVAPDGPYSEAWQGWQKENAISLDNGITRQTYGNPGDPYTPNPLESNRSYRPNGNVQLNGFAPVGDGPAMFTDEEGDSTIDETSPSLLATIFGRLGR